VFKVDAARHPAPRVAAGQRTLVLQAA